VFINRIKRSIIKISLLNIGGLENGRIKSFAIRTDERAGAFGL